MNSHQAQGLSSSRLFCLYALVAAFLFGGILRLWPAIQSDFPLNDGALFWLMTEEIQRSHFALPAFTQYNNAQIPFAYPPFAFYLAAFLSNVTGAPSLDILRVLPAVVSTLTIPVFYFFARSVLRSPRAACFATFAFALIPYSFTWYVMGGGLTRAPGLLFGLWTLREAHQLMKTQQIRYAFSTTIAGVLLLLSHPAASWMIACSIAIFLLFYGRDRRVLFWFFGVALAVVSLTYPWWLSVVSRHGAAPFFAAFLSGQNSGIFSDIVKGAGLPQQMLLLLPLSVLVLWLVLFWKGLPRPLLLPVWLGIMLLLAAHGGATYVALPLCLILGKALNDYWRGGEIARGSIKTIAIISLGILGEAYLLHPTPGRRYTLFYVLLLVGLMLCIAACKKHQKTQHRKKLSSTRWLAAHGLLLLVTTVFVMPPQAVLSHHDLDAMQWIARKTSVASTFLVMPEVGDYWAADPVIEWFPVLAERHSTTTAQGTEWLANGEFFMRLKRVEELQKVAKQQDADGIRKWLIGATPIPDYIYLSQWKGTPTLNSKKRNWTFERTTDFYENSPQWRLAFDNGGARIYQRVR